MVHPEILEDIRKERKRGDFIYPYYGKLSIAEIVPSILSLHGISTKRNCLPTEFFNRYTEGCRRTILCIVDGLGYNSIEACKESTGLFKSFADKGDIYPLTSVFPSTTPAALTTLQTGLTPQEHGLPEWTVYFEEMAGIVEPLMFRRQKDLARDSLLKLGIKPDILFEGETIYKILARSGQRSYYFMPSEYFPSAYSSVSTLGSTVITFHGLEDLMAKIVRIIELDPAAPYLCIYWSAIDGAGHAHGPESREYSQAIAEFSGVFVQNFLSCIDEKIARETRILLTADHGHTSIRAEEVVYLNDFSYLESSYLETEKGEPIPPTGGVHDVFLFIKPEKIEHVMSKLRSDLSGRAEILTSEEGFQRGLFGLNTISARFRRRVGNVLILPFPGNHVWYKFAPNNYFYQHGTHGGLSAQEMLVPLCIGRLSELRSLTTTI